jgi:hypothetical protein
MVREEENGQTGGGGEKKEARGRGRMGGGQDKIRINSLYILYI